MMEKNNSFFEDRNSDWLAQEIKREKRVSPWDFDEGKKVRNEHEENCEKEEVAEEHRAEHDIINTVIARQSEIARTAIKRADKTAKTGSVLVTVFVIVFFLIIFANILITIGSGFLPVRTMEMIFSFIPMIIFIIVISVVLSAVRKK